MDPSFRIHPRRQQTLIKMHLHPSTLLLVAATAAAFSPSCSSSRRSALSVATDPTLVSSTPSLIPPSKIDASSVASLFEERVQKTYGRYPITFVEGKGCWLVDEEGTKYLGELHLPFVRPPISFCFFLANPRIPFRSSLWCPSTDFVSGIATCALGHANPELTEAVSAQMTKLHHVSNLYYTPQQAKLAAWLCENSCADKAFFCNSGAESNEAAIKLARRHASNRGITVSTRTSSFVANTCFIPAHRSVAHHSRLTSLVDRIPSLSLQSNPSTDAPWPLSLPPLNRSTTRDSHMEEKWYVDFDTHPTMTLMH